MVIEEPGGQQWVKKFGWGALHTKLAQVSNSAHPGEKRPHRVHPYVRPESQGEVLLPPGATMQTDVGRALVHGGT